MSPWWRHALCATALSAVCHTAWAAPPAIPSAATKSATPANTTSVSAAPATPVPWSEAKLVRDSHDGLEWRGGSPPAPSSPPRIADPQPTAVTGNNVAIAANTAKAGSPESKAAPTTLTKQSASRPTSVITREAEPLPLHAANANTAVHSVLLRQPASPDATARSTSAPRTEEGEPLPLAPDPQVMRTLARQQTSSPVPNTPELAPPPLQHAATIMMTAGIDDSPVEANTSDNELLPAIDSHPASHHTDDAGDFSRSDNDRTEHSVLMGGRAESNPVEDSSSVADRRTSASLESLDSALASETPDIPPVETVPVQGSITPPAESDADAAAEAEAAEDTVDVDAAPDTDDLCSRSARSCENAWNLVHQSKLSEISLDTTPPYEPGEKDRQVADRKREQALSQTEFRAWHDRNGKVLAEGQLHDFKFGRLMILGSDGQIRSVPQIQLSDEDACFLARHWNFPTACRFGQTQYEPRNWHLLTFTWTASAVCHKPLYFEDVALERYGHTSGPYSQTFLSGAHFFGNVLLLPYNMGLHSPTECQYSLGYYRPGSCAPWQIPALPISARAIRYQASAVLGISAFIP